MLKLEDLKVGDEVYVRNTYNQYSLGRVTRRTPSGLLDVTVGSCVTRFNKEGLAQATYAGESRYRRSSIDLSMSVAERTAEIAEQARIDSAAAKIYELSQRGRLGHRPSSTVVKAEIARIRGILDEAEKILGVVS